MKKKIFSLESDKREVKGIVISKKKGGNYFIQVVKQKGTTLVKKHKTEATLLAQGDIVSVFKHLPESLIDSFSRFSVCIGNDEVFVHPIKIGSGNKKYIIGARVETLTEVKIVNFSTFEEYQWLFNHKPKKKQPPIPHRAAEKKHNQARTSQIK